jgi:hypothetical protein
LYTLHSLLLYVTSITQAAKAQRRAEVAAKAERERLLEEALDADDAMGSYDPWGTGRYRGVNLEDAEKQAQASGMQCGNLYRIHCITFSTLNTVTAFHHVRTATDQSVAATTTTNSLQTQRIASVARSRWLACAVHLHVHCCSLYCYHKQRQQLQQQQQRTLPQVQAQQLLLKREKGQQQMAPNSNDDNEMTMNKVTVVQ